MVTKKILILIFLGIILVAGITAQVSLNNIKESNKRIVVDIEGVERNYPLDIRNQTRYDQYGRPISNDWDRLEEYIEKDKTKINEVKEPEVFKK